MASDTNVSSATFESRLTTLETNFAVFVQEMKDFKDEMKDFKNEMRDRDNRRADEIATLNARIDEKFERILNQIQTMAIAAVVGIGAVVVGVVSIMKP